jgi:hypothetical protein
MMSTSVWRRMRRVILTSLLIKKCITTIRMLAYRIVGDLVDEYIHIIKSTRLVSMHNIIVEDERDNIIYDQG